MCLPQHIKAQAPNKMTYQAVIRDGSDGLITSSNVGLRIQILQGSEFGAAVYVETHSPTTNTNGLVSIEVGTGNIVSGDFTTIDWTNGPYFIKNEVDPNGGTNYTISGTSELLSVPYALHAASAKSSANGISDGSAIGNTLYWEGNDWISSDLLRNNGNRIGIGDNTLQATFHIGGFGALDGILVTGGHGQGQDLSVSGSGTRMMFYPKKSAFRAGRVTGNEWDNSEIGDYSSAWGLNTIASGEYSVAWGTGSLSSGEKATAWGRETEASGTESTAWGRFSVASGDRSTAFGNGAVATDIESTAFGDGTTASAAKATAWGTATEASGVDSTAWGSFSVASGDDSTAFGDATASGDESTAFGSNSVASGATATAWGRSTEASGIESTAWGSSTVAAGKRSTAWGDGNEALGDKSTSWGENNLSSEDFTTTWGRGVIAKSVYETVIGRYNTDYTPSFSSIWSGDDRLFTIGNGDISNRNDAMVVLKNGNTGFGISEPQHTLTVGVTTNTSTPNGDGLGVVNQDNSNYWNIHMSGSFLRFSFDNNNVSSINSGTGAYVQNSDESLKENIKPAGDNILERLNQIKVVKYNYKRDKSKTETTGVIAQELQELFPEFVHQDGESDILGVNYAGLSLVAIQGIQEQQEQIDALESENKAQQQQLDKLQSKIEVLEEKMKSLIKNN